jgi:hypothetical protein
MDQAHLGIEEKKKELSYNDGCIYLEFASEVSSRDADNTIGIVTSSNSSSTGVR